MNHPHFSIVKSIDVDELFEEAKLVKRLAFNQFAEFIKKELDSYYMLKTKNADPARFLGKEKELQDYYGAKLYIDTKVIKQANEL